MTSEVPNEPANQHSEDVASAGISRRGVVRAAGAGALALGLSGATAAAAQAASAATHKGPGSLSSAPKPPPGFTSRFIHANGLRQHVVIGGDGPPLLLVHGWPQFWYAWRLIMPGLARDFRVIAVDQRGRGQTSKPPPGPSGQGYDTGTLANDLAALMDALGHQSFSVVGHDTGMDIAYALAADHRGRVDRLAVAEAVLPGVAPSPPLFLPQPINDMLFHLMFNKLPTMNVQLVHGREDIYFGFIFDVEAFKKLPGFAVRVYIDDLADSLASLSGSFGFYRATDTTTAQNAKRAKTPLTLPVLAIGGAESAGDAVGKAMQLAATHVQTLVIPNCGHFVPEEAPKQLLAALTAFLAPHRKGTAAHNPRPDAAASLR
jgi:pimeloyl-ACP methyl ester carboxylesterase